jgi:CubicO group peptidase (beta-lactamase class C family)
VSKLFTGTAAMQLYEVGTVNLDVDVNRYLPWAVDIPGFINDSITMRQLMTHSSSIDDYWATMNSNYLGYPDPTMSLADCMGRYFPSTGADYDATNNFRNNAPGTVDHYSNMATALNGFVVERNGGTPFDDFCDSSIFEPLQMKNTDWHFSDFDSSQIARPYNYDFQAGIYVPYDHYGWAFYPAGNLRSNVLDLGNFMMAYLNEGTLGNNTILSSTSVNEMLTEQTPSLYPGQGLNWYQEAFTHSGGQTMLWGHAGRMNGYRSYLFIDTLNDIGVCVLANRWADGMPICNALYDYGLNTIYTNEFVINEPKIEVFPNPAKDFIIIEMDLAKNAEFEIYSSTGKQVLTGSINPQNNRINLSSLSTGLYLLKVEKSYFKLMKTN